MAKAERVAGLPRLPEPISGHSDDTKVTRITGPGPGELAGKTDPFTHLPVHGAPDPGKQKDMIGRGGVTRQTGVLHQDAQGSLRVDIPKDFVDQAGGQGAIVADRRPTPDEDQVTIVDPSMIHRPIVQGGLEKVGVQGFKGDKDYEAWLGKLKAGPPQNASVAADQVVPGVQMPMLPPGSQTQIPADQLASYARGSVYPSDRIASPDDIAEPVRYGDLHDPKAGKRNQAAMEKAHAEADRAVEGSRQRRAAPRKPKRRTTAQRSRGKVVKAPRQPSATGGAPEDAERAKDGD